MWSEVKDHRDASDVKDHRTASEVRNHRDKITAKVIEIKSSADGSAYDSLETRKLDLKERQVAAQEALVTTNTNQNQLENIDN